MTVRRDSADIDRDIEYAEKNGHLVGAGGQRLAAEVVALRAERDFHEERYKQEHRTRHAMEDTIAALRAELAEAKEANDAKMVEWHHLCSDMERERAAREAAERERDRRRDEQEELSRVREKEEAAAVDRDRLARRVAELEAALRGIEQNDELVEVNDAAFSIYAFRRCQQIARAALAGYGGGA